MYPFDDVYNEKIEANLRRIKLANDVLTDVHRNIVDPLDSEEKANLLLATEDLAETVYDLIKVVREVVWSDDLAPPPEDS